MSSPRFTVYGRKAKSVQNTRIVPLMGTTPRVPRRRNSIRGFVLAVLLLVIGIWVILPIVLVTA